MSPSAAVWSIPHRRAMPKPTGYGTRPHALTFHIYNPITLLVPYCGSFLNKLLWPKTRLTLWLLRVTASTTPTERPNWSLCTACVVRNRSSRCWRRWLAALAQTRLPSTYGGTQKPATQKACVRYSRRVPKSTRGSKIVPPPPHARMPGEGHMPCVLELLEAGAHLEKSGPGTALHMATTNDREACVRALIKVGANVDALSCRGHTPLVIHDIACSGTIYYMTRSSPAFCSTRMPIPSAAVWSMPLCRVLWFFSINYLRKKK